MPQWIVDALKDPVWVTAFGTALLIPLLTFLSGLFERRTPPPTPVIDDREIETKKLVVPWKHGLSDEEREMMEEILKYVEKLDGKVTLLHDRLSLMMNR